MNSRTLAEIDAIAGYILEDYSRERTIDKLDVFNQPDKDEILDLLKKLMQVVYPGYYKDNKYKIYNVKNNLSVIIEDILYNLNKQIAVTLKSVNDDTSKKSEWIEARAHKLTTQFLATIPKVREYVETDVLAAYEGDPAATSYDEIIYCYPGLYAITVNRLAHELYLLGVPLIPRIMTEYAHSRTGIDIHPGATLGKYFFIDHGTGIVIGETTEIGEHVKIYQGVTLGALSTRGGQDIRGQKRHPTIEDYVTIYSGASILGGETVIGKNAIIGGNAFITSSVEAGARVIANK
ncbi:MAG: serine acetyltransferase [Lachnospiraceae bacterium]|nr:serine acetyltransferase [Lachnospiraceae bacterium]